jgi:nitrite reductase/ring-hydroxylating ferredoxin subunit
MTLTTPETLTRVASLEALRAAGRLVVSAGGQTILLLADGAAVHAVDNRCPHMGFPLHRGSVADGILTCHWHHARFDLCSGGTFDQWADELPRFRVELDGDDVYVDVRPAGDPAAHQRARLRVGLERNLPLVVAKATLAVPADDAFRDALLFGVERRGGGWNRGLTTLVCLANLAPRLDADARAAALYHGVADVAADSAGMQPRFPLAPLPAAGTDPARLARWFRRFVEVRDAEGAERVLVSAVRSGATCEQLADMLFAACTDHRYLELGHVLDFVVKALEALDLAGWEHAEAVLPSLAPLLTGAQRMEETNAWRSPVDLVALLDDAFAQLPEPGASPLRDRAALVESVLGDDPAASVAALLGALDGGVSPVEVASAVTYAAAVRIARFPTSNEFADWDTALHTFTFANAVEQGLRRSPSRPLVRGIFDAAASVYLDRFLNVPPARLPEPGRGSLLPLLDAQQQVDAAARVAAAGEPGFVAELGTALVREDRNFHTIQCVEAAVRQHELLGGDSLPLVAAARYLAAHAPTARAQRQTFEIARRLHRGDRLHEEA